MHDAEAPVAPGPLEAVEQRPHDEPAQVDAGGDGVVARPHGRRGSPGGRRRAPGRRRPARPRTSLARDGVQRRRLVVGGHACQRAEQSVGFDRPPVGCRRAGAAKATSGDLGPRRRRLPRRRARSARGRQSSAPALRGGRSGRGRRRGCGRDCTPAPGPRARRRGRPPAARRRTTGGWRCRRSGARHRGRRRPRCRGGGDDRVGVERDPDLRALVGGGPPCGHRARGNAPMASPCPSNR